MKETLREIQMETDISCETETQRHIKHELTNKHTHTVTQTLKDRQIGKDRMRHRAS